MIEIKNLIAHNWCSDWSKIYYLLYEDGKGVYSVRRVRLRSSEIQYHHIPPKGSYLDGKFTFKNIKDGWSTIMHETTDPSTTVDNIGNLYDSETSDPEEELRCLLVMRELIT